MQKKVLIGKALLTVALLCAPVLIQAMEVANDVDSTVLTKESLVRLCPSLAEQEQVLKKLVTALECDSSYQERSVDDDSYILIGKLLISKVNDTQLLGMALAKQMGNTVLKKWKKHVASSNDTKSTQSDETGTVGKSARKDATQLLGELTEIVNSNKQLMQPDPNDELFSLIGKLAAAKDKEIQKLAVNLVHEFKKSQRPQRSRASSSASKHHENGKVASPSAPNQTNGEIPTNGEPAKKEQPKIEEPNKTNQKSGFGFTGFVIIGAGALIAGYFINQYIKNQQDK